MSDIIKESIDTLAAGKLLLYPTDTIWGIGCDATNEAAVKKVYQLKQREDSKALIVLMADWNMFSNYLKELPLGALDIISMTEKPLTIIYPNISGLASNLYAADQTVAIRIPEYELCTDMIKKFGKPIVSTSANISGFPSPKNFSEISSEVKEGVDYILEKDMDKMGSPSMVVKLDENGEVEVIRA